MLLLQKYFSKIPRRFITTFIWTFAITVLTHLFVFTNGFLNHDSLFDFYGDAGSDGSGRFTIKYFKGISSYFDLHYVQGILSALFLGLTVAFIVELFNLKSKWVILPFSILYVSYPTIAGTFAYMFTSHAYFLANLLTVIAIYLCYKLKPSWVAILASAFLVYLALGTYQINVAYGSTLVVLLFAKQLLVDDDLQWKETISSVIMLVIGLAAYVIHFKIYQKTHGLLDYNGINDAGISLETIQQALLKTKVNIGWHFFNGYNFEHLYEKLNLVYLIVFIILVISVYFVQKPPVWKIALACISLLFIPFTLYLIYFISPDVIYHLIMKQHFALLFVIGLALFQVIMFNKNIFIQLFSIIIMMFFALTSYNQILITNIYYEKFSDLNQQTYSLMTRVAYDIQHTPGYSAETVIVSSGYPSTLMKIPERYNLHTPENVGIGSRIVYDFASTYSYLINEIGLPNPAHQSPTAFREQHKAEIKAMPNWPSEGSIKYIDNILVIKFSEGSY